MADKKISELPLLNSVSGSSMIIPVVHDGTTTRVNLSQIGHYASQWSAQTGSANTFTGTQTINGNVNISGRLTVHEIVANYETSSILFSTGSTKLGDQLTDIHEFTGSTNITGSFYYNNVLVTNIDANTVFKLQQATASIQSATSSLNQATSSLNFASGALEIASGSYNRFYQATQSLHLATQSLNYFYAQTSSQDAVNLRISSTTGSINTTTSSFDNVFLGISSVTGAMNTTTSSFDSVFLRISSTTGSINVQSSSQDLVNRGISSVTGSINTTTASFDSVFLRISSTTGSINATTSSFNSEFNKIGSTTASIHFTTGALNAFTGSVIGQTNTISTFTSSVNFTTQSLNTQTGSQDLVNRGISSVTGSINTTTSSFNSVFSQIGSTTSSLIGITNGLMAFTAALDSTYATDAQLYQLYQATSSIHSTTQSLNVQTGSQQNLNSQIGIATSSLNTFSGSIRSEVNLLESYTASLKAAAIVSSSTQISNYYKFAETASANTFYGTQTINGNLQLSSTSPLVYNAGNTNAMLFGFFDGSSIYGPYYQIFGSNYSNVSQRGSAEFVFDSRNGGYSGFNVAEFNGSTWLRKFRVSQYGVEVTGSFIVDGGITGSIMATNGVVSSSTQIVNYNLFALTASANTFWGTQTFSGSLNLSGSMQQTGLSTLIGNTVLSGSIAMSGSTLQTGNNTLIGNTVLSGSILVSGSSDFKNSEFRVTGSSFFTGSHTITGNSTFSGSINIASGSSYYRAGNKLFNYGQWYSLEIQSGSANTAYPIKLGTAMGNNEGFSITNNGSGFPTRITAANTGLYNIQFSLQLNTTANENLDFSVWFAMTGSNVANSNTDFSVYKTAGGGNGVAALNLLTQITAGDYVELYWSNTTGNGQLEYKASQSTPTRPVTPSAIVTITQHA